MTKNAIVTIEKSTQAMQVAIMAWADSSTDATSLRRTDLLRDKSRAVADFFTFTRKSPDQVTPGDVKAWQLELEARGLSPSTVYGMISRVSSFFTWAHDVPGVEGNPVDMVRPKAPKSYQSESTEALSDDQVEALLQIAKAKADSGSLVGKRDYAMLLFYALTGRRRQEVVSLCWGDVRVNGTMIVTFREKGGELTTREVRAPAIKDALLDYLAADGRLDVMTNDSPLWVRHDRGAPSVGMQLTSHGFVLNVKRYARQAGLGDIHLHQLRHSFARMYGDDIGSLAEVSEALGHRSLATTRIYLQRVGIRRDRHSERLATRLGIGGE